MAGREFNVMAYGAQNGIDPTDPDLSFDNFAAFRAALDDAIEWAEATPGAKAYVRIPEGRYYVRMTPGLAFDLSNLQSWLGVSNNTNPVFIVGDGSDKTFIKAGPNSFSQNCYLFVQWHASVHHVGMTIEGPDNQLTPGVYQGSNFSTSLTGDGIDYVTFTDVVSTKWHSGIANLADNALVNGRIELHIDNCEVTAREASVLFNGYKHGGGLCKIRDSHLIIDDPDYIATVNGSALYTSTHAQFIDVEDTIIEHKQPDQNYAWQSSGSPSAPFDTNYPNAIGAWFKRCTFIGAANGLLPCRFAKSIFEDCDHIMEPGNVFGVRCVGNTVGLNSDVEFVRHRVRGTMDQNTGYGTWFSTVASPGQIVRFEDIDFDVDGDGARFWQDTAGVDYGQQTVIELDGGTVRLTGANSLGIQSRCQSDRIIRTTDVTYDTVTRWLLSQGGSIVSNGNTYLGKVASTYVELVATYGDITASFSNDTFGGPGPDPIIQVPGGNTITVVGVNNTFVSPAVDQSWNTSSGAGMALTDLQYVRLRVFGSTTGGTTVINDTDLQALIDQSQSVMFAAAEAAASVASFYALKVDRSIGRTRVALGQIFDHYTALAERLLSDAQNGGDGTGIADANFTAGGVTFDEYREAAQDSDRVPGQFYLGMNSKNDPRRDPSLKTEGE